MLGAFIFSLHTVYLNIIEYNHCKRKLIKSVSLLYNILDSILLVYYKLRKNKLPVYI